MDITITEVLCFPAEQRPVLRAYPEFEDLPEDCPVAVYSLNEIATEVVALSDPARNEARDLYDLWFLTVHAGVDLSQSVPAIAEKLRFRQKEIAGLEDRILKKEQRLKALWTGRLGHQIETLPESTKSFARCAASFVRPVFPADGLSRLNLEGCGHELITNITTMRPVERCQKFLLEMVGEKQVCDCFWGLGG